MKHDNASLTAVRRLAPVVIALIFEFSCFSQTLRAQEPDTQPSTPQTQPSEQPDVVKKWFGDLASPNPKVRSEATTFLMGLSVADLPTLKETVRERPVIEPAQAAVLREIVTQVILAGEVGHGETDQGFLGVHMETLLGGYHDIRTEVPTTVKPAVLITERVPGFAAARVLRDGDLLLSILDRPDTPILVTDQLIQAIKQFKAGTTIRLQILRNGEVIVVPIKLSARPVEADVINSDYPMRQLVENRRIRADQYWSTEFAPLLKESITRATE